MAGEAEGLLVRFGRTYAAAVRLATLVPICAIAPFRAPAEHLASTLVVVVVAAAWTCGFAWWLRAGRGSALVAVDVAVLVGLFGTIFWTDAVDAKNTGWLRLLVIFACATYQWHTSWLVGLTAATVSTGGAVALLTAAGAWEVDASLATGTMYALPGAVFARAAWILVRRAARQSDQIAEQALRARGEALLAAGVRAEEREQVNSLHDTAATTLLMVGLGQVRSDAGWLAPQARRDLARLRTVSGRAPEEADLVDLLRADLALTHLTVDFDGPERLRLPYPVARAITDAAGEAFTNVRRHSGATEVTVRLGGDARALHLDIADRGKGFAPHDVPGTRRGVRESIRARMERAGGTATITSAVGEGTRVRLGWRAEGEAPVGDGAARDGGAKRGPAAGWAGVNDAVEKSARTRLGRGMRIATLVVAMACVFGVALATLVANLPTYQTPLAQIGAFAVLGVVLIAEAVLLVRGRSWGRWRVPVIAAVLAASMLAYVTMPDGRTSTGEDWMFAAATWPGLVVVLDRPLRAAALFLLSHELTALFHLVVLEGATPVTLARFATGSVTVAGFPLCLAVVASALHRVGTTAVAARRELEQVRVAEAVAAQTHDRRQARFAELSATTVPLLDGLADGSLRPEDPLVQRRCAIEAARMRRLFAESDGAANPLLHELRHCIDVADRKGVVVELDSRGQWPTPPVAVRRDLTDAALVALATATSRARVTVVGSAASVSVSVVADCDEIDVSAPAARGVRVEALTGADAVWMEAHWEP
ncbi:ATP-binding protein [Nonomuraea endophytica]|uniref:Signal transduction histidine kinase n=1 Tax=Nonomuraea endophytica TaxID=714136 RepID=A0A7W8EHE4_9ACTN|nr:ATP-binding protein [Nonomuraea endophytica]MBB5079494.1 signal transduction histidine kinase [Nonomuraea endophytica]